MSLSAWSTKDMTDPNNPDRSRSYVYCILYTVYNVYYTDTLPSQFQMMWNFLHINRTRGEVPSHLRWQSGDEGRGRSMSKGWKVSSSLVIQEETYNFMLHRLVPDSWKQLTDCSCQPIDRLHRKNLSVCWYRFQSQRNSCETEHHW